MELAIIIILTLTAIIIGITIDKIKSQKKLKARISSTFGKTPQGSLPEIESIKRYTKFIISNDAFIDDITWNDLDMDIIFERINNCQSSVGEEYLYSILHQPLYEQPPLQERERLIKFFDEHPTERLAAQIALAKLGKFNHNGLARLIFNAKANLLPRAWVYDVLALMPLISGISIIFTPFGLIALLVSISINAIVQIRTMRRIDYEIPSIGYFASMMKCCKRLFKIDELASMPIMAKMKKSHGAFKKIMTKAPTRSQAGATEDITEMLWIYFSTVFLYDIRHYNKFMKVVIKNNESFHTLYKTVGEIETAISVLSFRKSLPAFCIPAFHAQNTLDFEGIYHPLIQDPVTNTFHIKNNSLITGSNASGKSTFIKILAINGILAQTIHTCTAHRFATRFSQVVTSMAMRDNLTSGESYFVVEVKSLRRIINLAKTQPCTCYIDEILRGTNTTERVAASVAVLTFLSRCDCLCLAASHDIELTRLLADLYDNYNFSEQVTDGGVTFDYKLKTGPSTTRNAIKLLDVMGFDAEIIKQAQTLAADRPS